VDPDEEIPATGHRLPGPRSLQVTVVVRIEAAQGPTARHPVHRLDRLTSIGGAGSRSCTARRRPSSALPKWPVGGWLPTRSSTAKPSPLT